MAKRFRIEEQGALANLPGACQYDDGMILDCGLQQGSDPALTVDIGNYVIIHVVNNNSNTLNWHGCVPVRFLKQVAQKNHPQFGNDPIGQRFG